jgi:nucleotide-binding universal stress UspA family protein
MSLEEVRQMGRYLVVAHQTASSPELLAKVKEIASGDGEAEFVLLVPATRPEHMAAWVEGEARAAAERAAGEAKEAFEKNGLRVIRTAVGDEAPVDAVRDELRENPAHYDAIVVSTLPLGISRWLGLDVPHQMQRRFEIPVTHVVAEAKTSAST